MSATEPKPLTESAAAIIEEAAGAALWNGAGKCINPEVFTEAAREVLAAVSSSRAARGAGFEERAEKFINAFIVEDGRIARRGVERLMVEFSSIHLSALGEAAKVADDPALEEPSLIGREIAKRIRALAKGAVK